MNGYKNLMLNNALTSVRTNKKSLLNHPTGTSLPAFKKKIKTKPRKKNPITSPRSVPNFKKIVKSVLQATKTHSNNLSKRPKK